MIERRGAIRYNFGAVAEVFGLEEPRELVSIAQKLSFSGCFVKTTTPFPEGTRVRVRITHSGGEFVAVGSVTANVSATGMGVVFTEIEASERAVLGKWMENPE